MTQLVSNIARYVAMGLAAATLLTIGAQANAASVSLYMDQSNVESFPDGINYLQVTISDGDGGDINFSVQTQPVLSGVSGSNYGIQSFSFNFGDSGASAANVVGPSGWGVSTNKNHSEFGRFDAQLAGTGSTRQDPLQFSIKGVMGDSIGDYATQLSSKGVLFAAHVADFSGKDVSSAHFAGGTSVVPIPATAWLMLSGLVSLLPLSRRRKLAKAAAAAAAA
jgi:hypothetical protein